MNQRTTFTAASTLLLAACSTTGHVDAPFDRQSLSVLEQQALSHMPTSASLPAADQAEQAEQAVAEAPAIDLQWQDYAAVRLADAAVPAPQGRPRWRQGAPLMQGFFGAVLYEGERSGGTRPEVDIEYDDMQVPTIGGGAQWKLAGDRIDIGVEAMLAFSWRSDATAIAVGGGGAAVAVDVDLFVFDLYGGPFASMFLGDNVRLYASVGPLMQWAEYEESSLFDDGNSSGFGLGYYARTGLELMVGRGSMIGMGVRWSDSAVDLSSESGDLDLRGVQIALTFSQFY
jgi:hypothetical protein